MRLGCIVAALGVCLAPLSSGQTAVRASAAPPPAQRLSDMQRALEEFRSQTRNLGLRADSPRKNKTNGSAASKSHGRLYENFRNDILDAVPHEIRQRGQSKNLLRRNQFGFNLAGPVLIPKVYNGARSTFFSISYEGVRERISRSNLRTIPTMPERDGDFSETVDQAGSFLPIFDPASTRPNPDYDSSQPVTTENLQYLRDPFPGNRIPVGRLEPVATEALKHYPAPNATVGPFFRNNYFAVTPETNTANGMIVKVDHTVRERHRLEFATAFSNGFAGSARLFPTIADPNPADRRFRSRRGSVQHTSTLSPRTVNNLEMEASTDDSRSEGDVFPYYRFTNYTPMGRPNPLMRSTRNYFGISDGLASRIGHHNVRRRGRVFPPAVALVHRDVPSGLLSFRLGIDEPAGHREHGSRVCKFPSSAWPTLVNGAWFLSPSYFRRNRFNIVGRDSWEIHPSLTVAGSLNYEISTPRVEKYDRQSTIDLNAINPANGLPGAMVVAGADGAGRGFPAGASQPGASRFSGVESGRKQEDGGARILQPQPGRRRSGGRAVGDSGIQRIADVHLSQRAASAGTVAERRAAAGAEPARHPA